MTAYLFAIGCIAFGIVLVITPLVITLAHKLKLIDDRSSRYHPAQIHSGTIPRAGGLAIYIGILVPMLLFLPKNPLYIAICIAATLLTLVGLIDDRKDVNPYIRLAINSVAVFIVILAGGGIPYITHPFTGGIIDFGISNVEIVILGTPIVIHWVSAIVSFIWIMWVLNIVGWSAGVDGQMPGFVSICALVLGILSMRYSIADPQQLPITILAIIVGATFLGFLPWNMYPQKIMPGYSGKTLAGFFLGLLAILSYAKLGTALLVLGIPTIDAVYTLIRRVSQKRSPVWADKEHLHHRLLAIGWSKRKIALFYWIVSAILGAIALSVTSKQKMFTFLVMAVLIIGFIVWVTYFTQFSKQRDSDNG